MKVARLTDTPRVEDPCWLFLSCTARAADPCAEGWIRTPHLHGPCWRPMLLLSFCFLELCTLTVPVLHPEHKSNFTQNPITVKITPLLPSILFRDSPKPWLTLKQPNLHSQLVLLSQLSNPHFQIFTDTTPNSHLQSLRQQFNRQRDDEEITNWWWWLLLLIVRKSKRKEKG